MEKIRVNQLQVNQIELFTDNDVRFYSYNTCICIYDYDTREFTLSKYESHFTHTTVKWLNRFLASFGKRYQDIKKTAKRANLNN